MAELKDKFPINNKSWKIKHVSNKKIVLTKKHKYINESTYFGMQKTKRPWMKRLDEIPEDMKVLILEGKFAGGTIDLINAGVPNYNITAITNNTQEYKELFQTIKDKKLNIRCKKSWMCDEVKNGYQYVIHDGMGCPYGNDNSKTSIIITIKNMFLSYKPWYHFEGTITTRLSTEGSTKELELSNLITIVQEMSTNQGYKLIKYHEDNYLSTTGQSMVNVFYLFQKINNVDKQKARNLNNLLFKKFRQLRKQTPREWTQEDLNN